LKLGKEGNKFLDTIKKKDRALACDLEIKNMESDEVLKNFIERFTLNNLKFPMVEDFFKKIDIKIDMFDISNELINESEDFKRILEEFKSHTKVDIRDYQEGFEKNVLNN
jgi:23S rRNA pseudoU1915 N3-methylase RlmH